MSRRLPVYLIGGFLGAGKTSLLHHLVSEHQGGHLALIIGSNGGPNLDAQALRGLCGAARRLFDTVREIPAGDEATQFAWMSETLRELTQAGRYESVWVELHGATNPVRWGQHFGLLPGLPETFSAWASLHQIITVVDALDFYHGLIRPAQQKQSVPWVDFLHAQVEGSSLLVLNKCDLIDDAQRGAVTQLLRVINPDAPIIQTDYGEVPKEIWLRPGTLQQVGLALEPRLRPVSSSGNIVEIPPEQSDFLSQHFRAWRPFHPTRFWDWFNADHVGLVRAKGLIWLASRHLLVGGISRTRWQNSCGSAGLWWDALPREEWPDDLEKLRQMQETWREPYGDRRQEITLVGDPEKLPAITRALQSCLLTDAELALSPKEWTRWPDPFPAWNLDE